MPDSDALFLLPSAVRRDPGVEAWFDLTDPMRIMVQPWFDYIRALGPDVRECLHDHMPTATVGAAAFAYVNAFTGHASVGFFHGTRCPIRRACSKAQGNACATSSCGPARKWTRRRSAR